MNFRQKQKTLRMCYPRYFAFVLCSGLMLAATGLAQPPASAPKTSKSAKPPAAPQAASAPKADPKAVKVLDEAIAHVKKMSPVEATLSERFNVNGLKMELDGRILEAPGQRLHAELTSDQSGLTGKRIVISDGATLWEVEQVGSTAPKVYRIDLQKVRDVFNRPGTPKEAMELFYIRRGFLGPLTLLEKIHTLMTPTRLTAGKEFNGHKVNIVSATWSKTVRDRLAPAEMYWLTMGVVGSVQVSLDATTGWPYRIEWLAQVAPNRWARTVRIDFGTPKHLAALSAEQQKEFTYNPPTTPEDRTPAAINQAHAIVKELKTKPAGK